MFISCDLKPLPEVVNCTGKVIADFSTDKKTCTTPCPITFNNKSSGATIYSWDFGNGLTSSAPTPTPVTYNNSGIYTVTLVAKNSEGCISTKKDTITVYTPPTAKFDYSPKVNILAGSTTVAFTDNSTGTINNYAWTFEPNKNSILPKPTYLFKCEGTKTIKLTVTGPTGSSNTTSQDLMVHAMDTGCNNYDNGKTQSTNIIETLRKSPLKTGKIMIHNDYPGTVIIELFDPNDWLKCEYNKPVAACTTIIQSMKDGFIPEKNAQTPFSNDWGIRITLPNGKVSCIRNVGNIGTYSDIVLLRFIIDATDIYN